MVTVRENSGHRRGSIHLVARQAALHLLGLEVHAAVVQLDRKSPNCALHGQPVVRRGTGAYVHHGRVHLRAGLGVDGRHQALSVLAVE